MKNKYKGINSILLHEGNGGVARKGWGAGEGTTGFATLSGPFPAVQQIPIYKRIQNVLRRWVC